MADATPQGRIRGTVTTGIEGVDDYDFTLSAEQIAAFSEKYKHIDHPLFMDEIPKDVSDYPELQALQNLLYDDQTPESLAEHWKKTGNELVSDGPKHYQPAIDAYTKGIEAKSTDTKMVSVLHSNRAHVHLLLNEYIPAVDDAREAIKLDSSNVKAYFRGAKGSYYLRLFRQASDFCEAGLKIDKDSKDIAKIKELVDKQLRELAAVKEKDQRQMEAARKKKMTTEEIICKTLESRGVVVGEIIYDMFAQYHASVKVDEHGCLHFPAVFLYDETMQSDFIEDYMEEVPVIDHLKSMFNGERFVEWDEEQKYTWNRLAVYYEGGFDDGHFLLVDPKKTLKQVLAQAKRVAKFPVFHMLVDGTPAQRVFEETSFVVDGRSK